MSARLYPPRRPQLISEVLDSAFKIFSASLLKALPYGMLITLAGQLVNIYNLVSGRRLRSLFPQDGTGWVLYALSLIVTLSLWAALILRQRAIAQGAPVSMQAELSAAVRGLPWLVLLTILNVVAISIGTVLLVIPGVYLLVALWIAVPVLVLEGTGPIDAIKSSLRLTRGNWWRTFAIFLVMLAIYVVFAILGLFVAAMVVQFERGADVAVVTATSTVSIISLGAFSVPFITAVMLAVLGDLTARRAAITHAARDA
jgi:hypothetical protein